ncbi:MAG TPA: ribosome maturation factor RimP [Thermodesulfovibrionales bacterium]|nr:ribosome maturation factor RimP [Thermodesulfovibrionales bacterium]
MDKNVERKIQEIAAAVAENLGFEVVDVSLLGSGRRALLRITIDREGGVTLGDCETFSRRFESFMDVEDPISRSYTLEVSSPGLDRPLKSLDDFKNNIGKLLRVTTKEKIENQSFFRGRLREVAEGIDGSIVTLVIEEKKGEPLEIAIPYSWVSKAQLEIEVK